MANNTFLRSTHRFIGVLVPVICSYVCAAMGHFVLRSLELLCVPYILFVIAMDHNEQTTTVRHAAPYTVTVTAMGLVDLQIRLNTSYGPTLGRAPDIPF